MSLHVERKKKHNQRNKTNLFIFHIIINTSVPYINPTIDKSIYLSVDLFYVTFCRSIVLLAI